MKQIPQKDHLFPLETHPNDFGTCRVSYILGLILPPARSWGGQLMCEFRTGKGGGSPSTGSKNIFSDICFMVVQGGGLDPEWKLNQEFEQMLACFLLSSRCKEPGEDQDSSCLVLFGKQCGSDSKILTPTFVPVADAVRRVKNIKFCHAR